MAYGPNMSQARIEMNAVLLPNGKVLAMGGSVNDEDHSTKSLNADLYDPATNTFSSAGSQCVCALVSLGSAVAARRDGMAGRRQSYARQLRAAHGDLSACLSCSSRTERWPRARPSRSAPASISYGNPFTVQTPDAASIASVVFIRNGTVTHAFGMDQRMVGMSFTAGSGSLTVTAPPNGNIAPPGYYMLFLLNSAGVPSVSKFVQVTSSGSSGPPSGISFVQGGSGPSTVQASNRRWQWLIPQRTDGGRFERGGGGMGRHDVVGQFGDRQQGNTYTRAVGPTTTTGLTQSIYYAKNIAAGSNTVTVKFNQAAAYPDVRMLEYSGLDTSESAGCDGGGGGTGNAARTAVRRRRRRRTS